MCSSVLSNVAMVVGASGRLVRLLCLVHCMHVRVVLWVMLLGGAYMRCSSFLQRECLRPLCPILHM
jgi:hypothetical protein